MDPESLTEEQKAKAKECNSLEELMELAEKENCPLSVDQLEQISGGNDDCVVHTTVVDRPVKLCPKHHRRLFQNLGRPF